MALLDDTMKLDKDPSEQEEQLGRKHRSRKKKERSCCCPSATRWALVLSAFLCESLRNWSIVERGTLRANESAVALAGTARRSRAQLGARGLAGL